VKEMGVLEIPDSAREMAEVSLLVRGKLGNMSVIKKDGCEFCTACGAIGACGHKSANYGPEPFLHNVPSF